MEANLKLLKSNIVDPKLQSRILTNLSDPTKIWIMDLFEIRKQIYINKTKTYWINKFEYIMSKIKQNLPAEHLFFKESESEFEAIEKLEKVLWELYKNNILSYEEYIYMIQNKLSSLEDFGGLRNVVDEKDSRLYLIKLEKQSKYSKRFTDTITDLPEIPENTEMISIHIGCHPKWKKFNIETFSKYIYYNCKSFEKKYKSKPKYIYSITELNLLFKRYWFDIYNLDDKISKRTWVYNWTLNHKIYESKPDNRSNKKRLEYQLNIPNMQKVQLKFTHNDIKFWIMEYDKFMSLLKIKLKIQD